MFDLIAGVLSWLYEVASGQNLGIAIVLLTLVVMVVMTPLTLSGTKSMIKMQRLQPELRKIQQKYKDDREKMNAEMMAFYQANNLNPVGGCLPLFFQLPVFLVLYRVLQGLTRRQVTLGIPVGASTGPASGVEGTVPTVDQLDVTRNFNPQYLDDSSELFSDLSGQDEIPFFFDLFDLSQSPLDAVRESVIGGLPYVVLILVVLVTSLYQQRQIQGRSSGASINPQQQALMKIMPWFLPVISLSLQSALILYFVVSNLYRIGQQAYITRALYGPGGEEIVPARVVEDDAPKKKGKKTGGAKADNARTDKAKTDNAPTSSAKKKNTNQGSRNRRTQQRRNGQAAAGGSAGTGDKTPTGGRRGAGAGRPTSRTTPPSSSRTGGGSTRSAKNRKKKR